MKENKKFNQNINCSQLCEFRELINSNDCFCRKVIKKKLDNRTYRYQYYNQLCACMHRIYDTSIYLENFKFKQDNSYGEAFDFYEFLNCLWIIYGCTEDMFSIFGLKLEDYLKEINCFKNSNTTNSEDVKFFKFIRSAASAHPSETTRYSKITKHKMEVYPYALWRASSISKLLSNDEKKSDIELLSWSSTTKCNYKKYYIYVNEFYQFINCVVMSISNLIPIANKVIENNIEKLRCKRLKKVHSFNSYHEYVIYLRNRLQKLNSKTEFPDGGLLLADHILQNDLIDDSFKKYVRFNIEKLSKQMLIDTTVISFNDIFDELSLYKVIKDYNFKAHYISEKFDDYLWYEAIQEIQTGKFYLYSKDSYDLNLENAKYAVTLLERVNDVLFIKHPIHEKMTFANIYEITLQNIYLLLQSNS